MQVDELVKLTEGIVGDLTVTAVREGWSLRRIDELDEATWTLLVRFVAGERPTETTHDLDSAIQTADRSTVIPVDPERATLIKDNPVPLRNVAERVDDGGHLILGGDFSGVELP